MSNEDECEQAYRAGWRAAGAAIAERIAAARDDADFMSKAYECGYVDGLDASEQIARDEVRGE